MKQKFFYVLIVGVLLLQSCINYKVRVTVHDNGMRAYNILVRNGITWQPDIFIYTDVRSVKSRLEDLKRIESYSYTIKVK